MNISRERMWIDIQTACAIRNRFPDGGLVSDIRSRVGNPVVTGTCLNGMASMSEGPIAPSDNHHTGAILPHPASPSGANPIIVNAEHAYYVEVVSGPELWTIEGSTLQELSAHVEYALPSAP